MHRFEISLRQHRGNASEDYSMLSKAMQYKVLSRRANQNSSRTLKHDWRTDRRSEWHTINSITPVSRVRRILVRFIGKSVDKAFKYYCAQVPKYQQSIFWEEFNETRTWYYRRSRGFQIADDGKTILKYKPVLDMHPGPYEVQTIDYDWEYRNIKTGNKLLLGFSKLNPYYRQSPRMSKREFEKLPLNVKINHEIVVLAGWSKSFKSPYTRGFKRAEAEAFKYRKRYKKNKRNAGKMTEEKFREILAARVEKEREKVLLEALKAVEETNAKLLTLLLTRNQ